MDLFFLLLAAVLLVIGILGSILPFLPGVPISWAGLLLLHLTSAVPMNYTFLGITLGVTLIIFGLQYAVPAFGTKYFGGSKSGMIGATIGLVLGIFIPVPGGIFIGPFAGAFLGEIINKSASKVALKAAFGSFLGLLASTFMELMVSVVFLLLFGYKVWQFREGLF